MLCYGVYFSLLFSALPGFAFAVPCDPFPAPLRLCCAWRGHVPRCFAIAQLCLASPLQCPTGPFNSFAKPLGALLCRCYASPSFSMLCLCCATYGLTLPCLCASLPSFLRVAVADHGPAIQSCAFALRRRSSPRHCSSAHCCALPFRLKAFLIVAIASHRMAHPRVAPPCRCCAVSRLSVLCRCDALRSALCASKPLLRFSQQRLYGCVNVCDMWNQSLVERLTKD